MNLNIESDVFDIVARLKEIDSDYYVVWNESKTKFELHHNSQPLTSYCLTFPYNTLDARCVDLALKTRAQNRDKLLREMNLENEKAEKEQVNNLKRRLYGS